MIRRLLATLGLAALSSGVWAGEALTGEVQKQPLNVSAIIMFVVFGSVLEAFGAGLPAIATATRVWRPLFPDFETLFSESATFIRKTWAAA